MFEDKVLKHKRAEGYYRRHAALGNVEGAWKNFVESNKVPDPSSMKLAEYIPMHERDNFNTPDLEQAPDSYLKPGETLEDFDVTFRKPNAEGGVQQLVQPNDDGSRPGYNGNPGALKVFNKALDSFYNEFDKEVVDAASIQDHGVTFDKLKGEDKRRNFKKYFKQDMKDYGEYIGTENPNKDRRTMKRGIRATREADIKIKLIDATKKGDFFKPEKFAEDNKITLKQLKAEAKQLQTNIYEKRMITAGKKSRSTLVWLSNSDFEIDNVLEKISKSGLVNRKDNRTNTIFYDAFGREFKKGTIDTPNPTYNFEKYKAIRKNVNEFGAIKKLISKKYNLNFDLDHGLSQQTINKLFNGTPEELSRVNIMDADLNRGFKKSLSEKYFKALGYNANGKQIGKVNLEAKKAVEKIAKDLNINIGNVSDDLKTFDRGAQSFEKLNIREELIKSLKNQKDLNLNFKTFINENPKLLTTAGFDITKINEPKTQVSTQQIDAIRKDMETLLVKLCPRGGNASGGRIGFNLGSGAACGAKFLEEKLKDGKGTKVERRLMAEVISKGAGIKNFLKGALNPLELLNPKNLIGPQAIALMGAFEVGDVTYDVINNNKPIKEALGDNWILKYASPYNTQEEQVKALEAKNISGSPAMQTYMEKIKLQAEFEREYKKLEKLKKDTPSKNNPKVQERIKEQQAVVDNLKNNWKQFVADKTIDVNGEKVVTLESGKQDFEQAFGQIIEKRQGGEYVTADDKQSLIKTYIEGESEGKYINTGADWANSGDLSHITGQHPYKYKMDLGKDQGRNISETEREARKLFPFETGSIKADYTKPTYKDFNYKSKKLPTELRQQYEKWATEQGVLDPSYPLKSSLSQLPMQDGSNFLEMLTKDYNVSQKAEQASMYPGYGGTQEPAKYAEGGIANTRVGFKTGSSIASLLSKFFKPKKTITIKRGESGTIGASGNSKKDFFNRYYFPPKGGFTNQSADARYFSKLGGPEGKPKVLTAEITPAELREGYRLRSLDSKDPEIGDIIIPQSAKDKIKTDYYNTIRARIEKILKNND